jgi:uncharacterized protein
VRIALVLGLIAACSSGTRREDAAPPPPAPVPSGVARPAAATPRVHLETPSGEVSVTVEVVATEAKIERGLMYRQHLPIDAGMLFLMGREKNWTFWMRNTLIPLDMIFITKDLTIAGIVEHAEPQTDVLRSVGVPSIYVLEVNAGWTAAHGVQPGAKVRFENVPPRRPPS